MADPPPLDGPAAVTAWLRALGAPLGEDPQLAQTPERVTQLWQERLLSGQGRSAQALLGEAIPTPFTGVVALTHLPFVCVCPHHLMPAYGLAHVAFECAGRTAGFGGIERLVEGLGRRLVLQEQVTEDIAQALMQHLGAPGAAVAIEATHLCLILQGKEPRQARVHTRTQLGTLRDRPGVLPPIL